MVLLLLLLFMLLLLLLLLLLPLFPLFLLVLLLSMLLLLLLFLILPCSYIFSYSCSSSFSLSKTSFRHTFLLFLLVSFPLSFCSFSWPSSSFSS